MNQNHSAYLLSETAVKELISQRFDDYGCCKAFPDQLHTFVGDCSSDEQIVVLVPRGDVGFPSNMIDSKSIIAVVGENISADYLEFLEDMQISYVFAGKDGHDMMAMSRRLLHDFGIKETKPYKMNANIPA